MNPRPFSKLRMLKMRPSSNTPTSVPPMLPIPPVNNVPPTTTEAMAESSHPRPSVGCPAPNWAARLTPAWDDERGYYAANRGYRTHRQVYTPRYDNKGHSQRDQAEHRIVPEEAGDVIAGQKVVVAQRAEQDQQRQGDKRPFAL